MICSSERNLDKFVVFDLETTGIGSAEKITEIGAVKVECGEIIDRYSRLVNPEKYISPEIERLTGISNAMVASQPPIREVLPEFLAFTEGLPLVAHNAPFDCSFLFREAEALGLRVDAPVVDTLRLARRVFPKLPSYKLTFLTDYFCIAQSDAHRAWCDAEATAKLYLMMRQ